MSIRSDSYRPDIDGLRAVAIVLVIVFHSGFGWINGGFIGVDVFFVISGFLIGGLLLNEQAHSGRLSLRAFWGRRARRLLPLSSLVIATTVILGMIVSVPLARQQISSDATSAALYVSNWTFARQAVAYSDRTVNDGLFTQFWSLSIEEQFYLLLPLIFLAVLWWSRRRPEQFARRLFGVVSAIVIVSFASSIWATGSRGAASYFLTYTRLWELGVGVAIAIWLQRRPVRLTQRTDLIALAGMALIIGSAVTFEQSSAYPGWRAAVPVVGTALVLVFAARTESAVHRTLAIRPLVVIGIWSYGWYLWHWPMIAIAVLAAQRWFPSYDNDLLVVMAIALSLLLAAISHQLVENPIRYWTALTNFPTRSVVLGIALTIAAALIGPVVLTRIDNGNTMIASADGTTAMTPAQAKIDYPRFNNSRRCLEESLETTVEKDCVFGDPEGTRTLALIGDSHAFHWLPALHEAATERGWRVIIHAKAGCPALPVSRFVRVEGAPDPSARRPYEECDTWQKVMIAGLRDEGPFDAVVVSGSYAGFESLINSEGAAASTDEATSIWSTQSRFLFEELLAFSGRVIRLSDTPWPLDDVPECLSAHPNDPDLCAIDVKSRTRLDSRMITIERSNAPAGVVFTDLTGSICPTDPCPVIDGLGNIKFHDHHHLSQTYSFSLSDNFAAMIESVLRTTKSN